MANLQLGKNTRIITIAVQKGGTGKTTTASALVQAAVYHGKRCLAIDLDPQANLSFTIGADTSGRGSYAFLEGSSAADVVQAVKPGLDAIPATWNLSTITGGRGTARRLQKALEPIKENYDLIIIDTPPTAGELQYNALQASTGLIIPLLADIYSLQSLYQITDTANQIMKSNPNLKIMGFILTKYDNRTTIAKQMLQSIKQKASNMGIPYLGAVHCAVTVKEAAALQRSLFEYAPKCKPAADYLQIFANLH